MAARGVETLTSFVEKKGAFMIVEISRNTDRQTLYYTVRSESHCALRVRYVDLVVSIEVAVEVCCCVTFRCIQPLNSG